MNPYKIVIVSAELEGHKMRSKHFLVRRAFIFNDREFNDPEDCVYDEIKGLWIWNKDKEVLVKSNHPKCLNITSKKQNVEKT